MLDFFGKTKTSLDIAQARKMLHNSVKLLSFCHSVVLQKRRTLLKPFILPRYQYLTKPNSEISKELLGSNIEQKILDSSKMSEASKKIRYSFHCGGRGGRFHRRNRYMGPRRGGMDRQSSHFNGNHQNSFSEGRSYQQYNNQNQHQGYQQQNEFSVKRAGFKPCGNRRFFRKK